QRERVLAQHQRRRAPIAHGGIGQRRDRQGQSEKDEKHTHHRTCPYFAAAALSRSCGIACAVWPLYPVMVSAATSAFQIASSVASAAAWKSGVHSSRPSIFTSAILAFIGTLLPVEKARKISPLLLEPKPPTHARPVVARRARRWHWIGSKGASVARITMIEPWPSCGTQCALLTWSVPISRP